MATKKPGIDAYKNRMTAPIGAVRLDPKTNKPITPKKSGSKKQKGK